MNDNPGVLAAMSDCWSSGDAPKLNRLLATVALWGCDLTTIPGLEASVKEGVGNLINNN
ncbi:MAG: hypothetical protein QM744_18535 [Mesorhizobium sp.]